MAFLTYRLSILQYIFFAEVKREASITQWFLRSVNVLFHCGTLCKEREIVENAILSPQPVEQA